MKRGIGFVTFVLGFVGLTACVTAATFLWIVRPIVMRTAANALAAADGGLAVVESKTSRGDLLVKRIRRTVDPVAEEILRLADEAQRTGGEEKELQRIETELAQRLEQVDSVAEAAETAL